MWYNVMQRPVLAPVPWMKDTDKTMEQHAGEPADPGQHAAQAQKSWTFCMLYLVECIAFHGPGVGFGENNRKEEG